MVYKVNWLFYIIFLVICSIVFTAYREKKKQIKETYDPFALWIMFSQCECQECKEKFLKPFERFEYAYQKTKWLCPNCKKTVECVILGSFYVNIKSPRELKWDNLHEKWYTDYERDEGWKKQF